MESKIIISDGSPPDTNENEVNSTTRTIHMPTFKSSQINKRMDNNYMPTGEIISDNEVLVSNIAASVEAALSTYRDGIEDTIVFLCIRQKIENDHIIGIAAVPINEESTDVLNILIDRVYIKPQISIVGLKEKK